MLVVILANEDW